MVGGPGFEDEKLQVVGFQPPHLDAEEKERRNHHEDSHFRCRLIARDAGLFEAPGFGQGLVFHLPIIREVASSKKDRASPGDR